jgi:hypothetical protein
MAVTKSYHTGLIIMTAAADAVTGKHTPVSFRLRGATTAGHTAQVTDTAGNVLANLEATAANNSPTVVLREKKNAVDGFILAQINSGAVEIQLK